MELKQLKMFSEVARRGSLTKAAIALDCSQSHLTVQIRKLEEGVGSVLFERRGRGVRLTDAGRSLLPFADRFEVLAGEAQAAVASTSGRPFLSIAAHESITIYRLPELLVRLGKARPDLDVAISPLDESRISRAARDGAVDLAIVYTPAEGHNHANEVILEEDYPVIACAPTLTALAEKGILEISDLRRQKGFVNAPPCPGRTSFDQMVERLAIQAPSLTELSSVEAIKQCAIRGLGYAVLPRLTLERELYEGSLVSLKPPGTLDKIATAIVFAPDKTRVLNTVITVARDLYRRDG